MLHGSAVITLYDSKTGDIINRIESDNIVTDSVSNLFNKCAYDIALTHGIIVSEDYISKVSDINYSIAEDLFGGILIFSEPIYALESHCIPYMHELATIIGRGNTANVNSSYDISSINGKFIDSESYIRENEVKFVWEFDENSCNGNIACVCLTSGAGSIINNYFSSIAKGLFNIIYKTSSFSLSYNKTSLTGFHSYVYNGFLYAIVYNKCYIYDINNRVDERDIKHDYMSYVNTLDRDCVYYCENVKLYNEEFLLKLVKIYDDAKLEFINISLSSVIKDIEDRTTFNVNILELLFNGFIYKDCLYIIYAMSGLSIVYKIYRDGRFISTDIDGIIGSNSSSFYYITGGSSDDRGLNLAEVTGVKAYGDEIILFGYSNDSTYVIYDDLDKRAIPVMLLPAGRNSNLPEFATDASDCSQPIVLETHNTGKGVFLKYLATINNIDTVITKDNSVKMKIEYTLRNY